MPGQGKYSNYADTLSTEDNKKVGFLGKLFSSGPAMDKKSVVDRAKVFLIPTTQEGADPQLWGNGGIVSLTYGDAPEISKVAFSKAGDPSTPYTPDVRSPGTSVPIDQLGSLDTVSINLQPQSGNPDVNYNFFKPNYVAGGAGSNTRSPGEAADFISGQSHKAMGNSLPASTVLDGSGAEIYKP